MRKIARIKNVDKSTLSRINRFHRSSHAVAFERMLSSATYKISATTVLTAEEEKMIADVFVLGPKEDLPPERNF